MKKENIIAFFDQLAKDWDAQQPRDEQKLNLILDCGQIRENAHVLDVACGTGILIPYYLQRRVKQVTAVDISPEMIKIAQKIHHSPRVKFINADIEALCFQEEFDCCMVYNAFPHFPHQWRLINKLAEFLTKNGNLTIAHSFGRNELNSHHAAQAADVSQMLPPAQELAKLFVPRFEITKIITQRDKYIVSGTKR